MPALALPFAHLNLRFNPFGEATASDRELLAVVEVDRFADLLRRGGAVEFVGDHGRGKSSHLLALHRHFPGAPFVKLERPMRVAPAPILFIDEVDRVTNRAALFARCRSIALGAHASVASELRAAGHDVESVQVSADPVRLKAIIARRIEWARRGAGPVPGVPDAAILALVDRFGDDVRAIEACLYDRFQELAEVGDVHV